MNKTTIRSAFLLLLLGLLQLAGTVDASSQQYDSRWRLLRVAVVLLGAGVAGTRKLQ